MRYTAKTLPRVQPMLMRKIIFPFEGNKQWIDGGKIVATECEVEEVGMADKRLDYDEDVIDVSCGIFAISQDIMMNLEHPEEVMIFPSRRWRCFREGETITDIPRPGNPLIFLGNPCLMWRTPTGCEIIREKSYLIKTGHELGY